MERPEWAKLVDRLNANYPGQELRPETATEWFELLEGFPAAEVEAAVERVIREREWMPTGVAVVLNAIDANWDEAAAARREQAALVARKRRLAGGGVPAPAEFTEARKLLERSTLPPYHPEHLSGPEARRQIEVVGNRLQERVDREWGKELFD